ncbi:MAG: hypothetical protein GXP29_02595 [Planctomycetes bacterium]|nr:hypothetical protein [Planctomycetota bacterium]
MLKTGVIGTSRKENESRVPIHPAHIERIPLEIRNHLLFEQGYGERFGFGDDQIAMLIHGLAPREELLAQCDVVIVAKPVDEDLRGMREGMALWGWPHCVQHTSLTELAIQRRLTLIAFEAMFDWTPSGERGTHIFYRNNELAGYCAVLHALQLTGLDGHYGPHSRTVILSFGSVSRGAAYALEGRGFSDITVFTQRPPHVVSNRFLHGRYAQMCRGPSDEIPLLAMRQGCEPRPMIEEFSEAGLIVNGILQDTDLPLMYMAKDEEQRCRPGSLIIDVSCDEGMGFPFARSTTFDRPTFPVGQATYYAVDHTPSYLWNAASWEISEALLPYLETVVSGPDAWKSSDTISRAIEIRDGVLQNPKILSFQRREDEFPHCVKPHCVKRS